MANRKSDFEGIIKQKVHIALIDEKTKHDADSIKLGN